MSQLAVIRHSKAQANEDGILMGAKFDSPLSPNGIELARQKGQALKAEGFAPDHIFCSQLQRAIQTAEIIKKELELGLEITQLPGLNERDFGEHDGKPYDSVLKAFEQYGNNPPTIEPVQPFVDRVLSALEEIKQASGTILVVTHSNPEMVLQAALLKQVPIEKFWELGDPPYCEGFETEV